MKGLYKDFASKNRLKIHQCLNVITPNKQDKLNKPDKPKRGGRMKGIGFRKITITVIVAMLCLVSLAGAQGTEHKAQEGYRIEVVVDTIQKTPYVETQAKEIKLISPEKEVMRKITVEWLYPRLSDEMIGWTTEKEYIIISPTSKYLIKAEDTPAVMNQDSLGIWGRLEEPRVKFTYMNAKGEEKWSKEFEIIYTLEETDDDDDRPYFFKIARDGSRIVFVKNYEYSRELGYQSDIFVYDTLGSKIVSVVKINGIEHDGHMQISPDGKIIGANIEFPTEDSKYRSIKHLFFLDVETGRTKVVRAEGQKWAAGFGLSGFADSDLPPIKKVSIGWAVYDGPGPPWHRRKLIKQGHKFLTFDQIPDDISTLFGGER